MTSDIAIGTISESLADVAAQVRASTLQVRAGRGGIGSGVIWSVGQPDASGEAEATIITNAHVVRAARETTFTLRLADAREIEGTLVGIDPEHDLAALRVKAAGLSPAAIGDSAALRVGEFVLAVGNPWGREGSVTAGVISAQAPADPDLTLEPAEGDEQPGEATERPQQGEQQRERFGWRPRGIDLIQADIRLYPGNSGGPLADTHGRVVGINAMIGGGLAFAIPSRTVQRFLEDMQHANQRAYLGVQVVVAAVSPLARERWGIAQEAAVLIAGVEPESPAASAGLMIGDVLLAVNGQPIQVVEQLPRVLGRVAASGQPLTLSLLRAGERLQLSLTPQVRAAA